MSAAMHTEHLSLLTPKIRSCSEATISDVALGSQTSVLALSNSFSQPPVSSSMSQRLILVLKPSRGGDKNCS